MAGHHVCGVYEATIDTEVMIMSAAHELQVAVGLMKKQENGGALNDMDAREASLVGIEGVASKAEGRGGHDLRLARMHGHEQVRSRR